MKKRFVAAMLAGTMALSILAGCGTSGDTNSVGTSENSNSELVFVNYRDIRDLNPLPYVGIGPNYTKFSLNPFTGFRNCNPCNRIDECDKCAKAQPMKCPTCQKAFIEEVPDCGCKIRY